MSPIGGRTDGRPRSKPNVDADCHQRQSVGRSVFGENGFWIGLTACQRPTGRPIVAMVKRSKWADRAEQAGPAELINNGTYLELASHSPLICETEVKSRCWPAPWDN